MRLSPSNFIAQMHASRTKDITGAIDQLIKKKLSIIDNYLLYFL